MNINKTAIAAALVFSTSTAQAVSVTITGVSFQIYDTIGASLSQDDAAVMTYDTTALTWEVSSQTVFKGVNWTASGGVLYAPGTYTIDINGDGADELPASPTNPPLANGDGLYEFTVPEGSWGGNIDFAWGASAGADVFVVWSADGNTVLDVDGDGIPGAAMVDGPFPGFSIGFSPGPAYSVVPIPAAVWLFASGLVGLAGMAKRRC